ncbi:phosphomannose isomerase type II C-terminal cupin domain [Nocardioides sp. GXZ039]|uniref:phosphomannose isomerase type II C-terminal cupin domain n=1 Tax=Nocardioides sp. GXZ039 TaxID=3136018 RepID=UPI0030F40DAD
MSGDHVTRPWGAWAVLDEGPGYKVKRITVHPEHRLSYQTHAHRAEHWTVVSGRATCVIDGSTLVVRPGESVRVDIGQAHRIANDGEELLVLIEVQLGAYCEEDDICRLHDDYGRDAVPQ